MIRNEDISWRGFLRVTAVLLTSDIVTVITGCSPNPQSGPSEIAWDRDICAYCRMIISDRAYAAQVRGGTGNKVYKFDDLGCAVNWLHERGWSSDEVEIWVGNHHHPHESRWLDARTAHYVSGQTTPMDYGFGAIDIAGNDNVDFSTVRHNMLKRSKPR